jgi:hypothetical protein
VLPEALHFDQLGAIVENHGATLVPWGCGTQGGMDLGGRQGGRDQLSPRFNDILAHASELIIGQAVLRDSGSDKEPQRFVVVLSLVHLDSLSLRKHCSNDPELSVASEDAGLHLN